MTVLVALRHRTAYAYDRPVRLGPQLVRLRPAPHNRSRIRSYRLKIEPENHFINWQQDPFSNHLARLVFPEPTRAFEIDVDLLTEIEIINPFDFFIEESAERFPFTYEPALAKSLQPYLEVHALGQRFQALLASLPKDAGKTIDFLVELNQMLQQRVAYVIRMEPGVQTPEETLEKAQGSCRDSAWLMVQVLRHLGIAARFVSGYLIQLKPDVEALDGPSGPAEDFTDLHAWTEAFLPGAGWIGFDPTSGLLAGEGHLPLAATPDPASAAPISGLVDPAEVTFDFHMEIERVHETVRVTKPYTLNQWQAIDRLGLSIDFRLREDDVRLTVGGEPTFVAAGDRDADEWNTDAVGPSKRHFADQLIRRLQKRFAPNGMFHFGQGKWYPGEQLPRWAFAVYWRRDGQPLWQNPDLIASEEADHKPSIELAERFAKTLSERLEVDEECTLPAYEDPAYFLAKERNLPLNLDPGDNKLEDPQERARLASAFERGLSHPKAYVLPIQTWQARAHGSRAFRWVSERWRTRREALFLAPGDSAAGYRLPLSSLAYVPPEVFPQVTPADPFMPRGPLPQRKTVMQAAADTPGGRGHGVKPKPVADGEGPLVRTALAVEPRDGRICVFIPPMEAAAPYVDLIAAIEETAEALDCPVHVEGYAPPDDPRLNVIKVTPDPGVIEVNIHPAASWGEQVEITEILYEEARLCRLDTSKFMLDGRPTGTGGGNHVVVGGPSAADSPFLRRPDVLASLIRYWQNHPALSYLFSGLFIGPTSQAPRIDEARDDQLYELEIALAQIPLPDTAGPGGFPPWLIDRILRNLLVDATGNTHRAEICIDKLYAPESSTGRLGLVEFRAFEMPPHPQMSLVQNLLLRALIAWFWRTPYQGELIRHGDRLHDHFMLPHFVWQDMETGLADLTGARFPFSPAWFRPHFEFRFPRYGALEIDGVEMELRAALEPWHVLGEDGAIGGTVRYVDSSLERLQLRCNGTLGGDRFVTCNGVRLPLRATDPSGEAVAGIRFRAWQPPNCLHPTIGVHSPLVFDLVDGKAGRTLGGFTYHVMHPAGRNYETLPVNDNEAEGRRLARLERDRHSPGLITAVDHPPLSADSCTLDLRRLG
ncbi:MAG: DUF2126 domain-containing protein [Geminicoccaceae bacterium]